MSKVYMVHGESGEYSDWCYHVHGIFSSYEKARAWLESLEFTVKTFNGSLFRVVKDYETPEELVGRGYAIRLAHPRTKDGKTFLVTVDRTDVEAETDYFDGEDYFITEYELDEGTRNA